MSTGFLFVHSKVDDAKLTPSQFRLLGHLARRAGSDGIINSSIENMRKVTGLAPCTIKSCLRELTKRNIIFVAEQREGQTPIRGINSPDDWTPCPVGKTTGVEKHTGSDNATDPGIEFHPPPGRKFHPQRVSYEGTPFEGNPENERKNEPILSNGSSSFNESEAIGIRIPKALREEPAFMESWDSFCQNVLEAMPRAKAVRELKRRIGLCRVTFEREGIEKVIEILEGAIKGGSTFLLDEDYLPPDDQNPHRPVGVNLDDIPF